MSLFGMFGPRVPAQSVLLIDIAATSVGGAYVRYAPEAKPIICYALRLPIAARVEESRDTALLRTLKALGTQCISEGAPAIARLTGRGSADLISVSLDAPWQELQVRVEHVNRDTPFLFTRHFVTTLLDHTRPPFGNKLVAEESVIGTILNGYETRTPYGKTAYRASVVVLTALIEERVSSGIVSLLRNLFHSEQMQFAAAASLRHQAIRRVFPHEASALILDVTEAAVSIGLMRRGILVALTTMPHSPGGDVWKHTIEDGLTDLVRRYPLPRTIFLLTRESDHALPGAARKHFAELWLSENPPNIIPITSGHVSGFVQYAAGVVPDLALSLMTLSYEEHLRADIV